MKLKKSAGFTLIELLVVIAIIGLLAALVTFSVTYAQARARDAKRVANLDQFMKALNLYATQYGTYPINASGVCLDGNDAVSTELKAEEYINSTVKEPIFSDPGRCFNYISDADGASYSIDYYLETNSVGPKGKNTRP